MGLGLPSDPPEIDLVDSPLSGKECEPFAVNDANSALDAGASRPHKMSICHGRRRSHSPRPAAVEGASMSLLNRKVK
jgi:hypothetical protein